MIYLTGDTHGGFERLASGNFSEGKYLTKKDYVIILGDLGLIWGDKPSREEIYWTKWLGNKPWTTLFLDGNHENFTRLDKLPTFYDKERFGAEVGYVTDSLFHLKRGNVYKLGKQSFFVFGGGLSIDKHLRIPGVSWWAREIPNEEEFGKLSEFVRKREPVDYVLTHVPPSHVTDGSVLDPVGLQLDNIDGAVDYNLWYFGHMHQHRAFDKKHICLYNDVVRLGDYPND